MTDTASGNRIIGAQSAETAAHAKGPWSVYDGRLNDKVFRRGRTVCAGEGSSRHAVAYCDYMWPDRAEANARLIAAAPDMLAALAALADLLPKIEAASSSVFTIASVHGCRYAGPNWKAELEAARAAIAKATGAA